jgi:hypothetical protein
MSGSARFMHRTLYGALLHLYPSVFRREYGGLMADAFSDRLAERGARQTWASMARDLSCSVPQQTLRETFMRQRWMAEVTVVVAITMAAATWVGAGPSLLFGCGVGFVAFLGLWSADLDSQRAHSVTIDVGPKRWAWWTVLGAAMAVAYVIAAAAQMLSVPKATNVGAFALMLGFAGVIALGLALRSRSQGVGYWMVIIAMVPALIFVWMVVPPLVAIAVICGAALEISKGRS